VEAGSCARKVWRLRMCSTQRMCSSQRGCDVGGALRLVRDDVDSDDRLISRCLGAEACSYPSDASLDASLDVAVDLMFPRSPCGPYRAFFRLVRSCVPAERDGPAAVDGFGGMIDGRHATQPPSGILLLCRSSTLGSYPLSNSNILVGPPHVLGPAAGGGHIHGL